MPTLTPQDFVSKWKRVTSREKQTYQEHFIDLCRLVDHQTPNEADPTGKRYAFEMGTAKTSGGQGWADVAKLGYFGWEYKGKDSDLDKAYDQLLRYRDSLNNPPLLVVSDINNIIIRTNYTNLPTRTYTLTLDDLLKPESLQILKTVFLILNNSNRKRPLKALRKKLPGSLPNWQRTCVNMAMTLNRSLISSSACYSVYLQRILGYCLKNYSRACWIRRAAIPKNSLKCSGSFSAP